MARALPTLLAGALGAAAIYFFDPRRGRRRRAILRDRVVSSGTRLRKGYAPMKRDANNRLHGLAALLMPPASARIASDETVMHRVRSTLGRYVSRPRAIDVAVHAGRVELAGDVLAEEHGALLRAVRDVDGVTGVDDGLRVHATPEGVPALQGGRPRHGPQPQIFRNAWSPALRAAAGGTGAVLLARGVAVGGVAPTIAGGLLILRSAANRPLLDTIRATGPGAIRVQKTTRVDAPIERVYEMLRAYDNFPQFMRNVKHVEVRPDGISHWTVAGPAGITVEWDAVTTAMEPNRLIKWTTVEGSTVEHAGTIRLTPENGGTRIHVAMSYTPVAGSLGHVVAWLFGADPKSELDEDLQRMKAFLEGVDVPHDVAGEPA